MQLKSFFPTLIQALGTGFAASLVLGNSHLQFRDASSDPLPNTLQTIPSSKTLKRDTTFKNSTSLDKSWNGATLFSIEVEAKKGNIYLSAGIEIVCTTCYIKGTATAQLTRGENFNITQAFQSFKTEVEGGIDNLMNATIDSFETYFENIGTNISSLDTLVHDVEDLDFPTLNGTTFDLAIPDIPECQLLFEFDDLELYMELDTTLSAGATYTLNLYKSETPIGVSAGQDLEIGIVFKVDVILSVEAEIDISSGFHIQLNNGFALNMTMFGQDISSVTSNGGQFEFLPVMIQSGGVVLTALLRLSLEAGLDIGAPPLTIDDFKIDTVQSGAGVGIWLNLAEFITNVTVAPEGDASGCDLLVEEVYSMAIGAQAGATLAILDHSWGPTPNTSTAFFYTTLASRCVVSSTSTAVSLTARSVEATSLTTTTISTKITYSGTVCGSTGLLNCPISLQTTTKNVVTSTLVTSVPSGASATFPATTQSLVASTIAFGNNVKALTSTSGTPASYTPSLASSTGIAKVLDGKTGGLSNKLIIGISIGVGIPVLLGIIAGCIVFFRRKRTTGVQRSQMTYIDQQSPATPYTPGSEWSVKKSPVVRVSETY